MEQIKLRQVAKGEFFKRSPEAKQVLVRDDYDHRSKTFCAYDYDDVGNCYNFKPERMVWVGFTF